MNTYTVIEESADDPESNQTWTGISAASIRANWPLFAALFPDNEVGSLSLNFTADLTRWRITTDD